MNMMTNTSFKGALAGLKVLDFGHYYAGPLVATGIRGHNKPTPFPLAGSGQKGISPRAVVSAPTSGSTRNTIWSV